MTDHPSHFSSTYSARKALKDVASLAGQLALGIPSLPSVAGAAGGLLQSRDIHVGTGHLIALSSEPSPQPPLY